MKVMVAVPGGDQFVEPLFFTHTNAERTKRKKYECEFAPNAQRAKTALKRPIYRGVLRTRLRSFGSAARRGAAAFAWPVRSRFPLPGAAHLDRAKREPWAVSSSPCESQALRAFADLRLKNETHSRIMLPSCLHWFDLAFFRRESRWGRGPRREQNPKRY